VARANGFGPCLSRSAMGACSRVSSNSSACSARSPYRCRAPCVFGSAAVLVPEIKQVSSVVTPNCSVDLPPQSIAVRSSCAFGILLIECFLFSVQFDSGVFDRRPALFWGVLASLPRIFQFFLYSFAAAVLFGGSLWKNAILAADARQNARLSMPSAILFHLLAVVSFYFLSTNVFQDHIEYPAILISGWLTLGVATCVSALRLILPINEWLNVLIARRGILFAGFGVGIL
jgi:hypothetical protein